MSDLNEDRKVIVEIKNVNKIYGGTIRQVWVEQVQCGDVNTRVLHRIL